MGGAAQAPPIDRLDDVRSMGPDRPACPRL